MFFLFAVVSGDPSCRPPNISFSTVNEQPLSTDITQPTKTKKSEDFVLFAKVASICRVSGQVDLIIDMNVYAIDLKLGSFHNEKRIVKFSVVDSVKLTITGKTLDYGLYFVKIVGFTQSNSETKVSSFGYVEVTSTTLVANISGASQASQGLNKKLTLNGSMSHDPDVGEGVYTGLDFTWFCKKEDETFPDNMTSLPVVNHPAVSTVLPEKDRGGCYGTGIGKLRSRNGFPYIIDLDVDKMKGDEDYVIQLAVRKRGMVVYAVHRLRIKEEIHLSIV